MGNYTIEARSLKIDYLPASHDFWVLRNNNGEIISELHGLATNRTTGKPEPIGTNEKDYSLKVWHFVHNADYAKELGVQTTRFSYIDENQNHQTVFSGSKNEAFNRWSAAVNSMDKLNKLDLNYPALGFKVFTPTINSNSTYRTLGEIMDVSIIDFPNRVEPGLDNRMIPKEEIDKIKYNKSSGYEKNQSSAQDENFDILSQPLAINSSRSEVINYAFAALMSDDFESLNTGMNNAYNTNIGQETLQQANQAAIDYDTQQAQIQQANAPVMKMA